MQKASILVLEDERAIAEMIDIILRKEGMTNITLCNTIEEAKSEIYTKTFDFYLLDIMLPDGNGFDVANIIREKSDAPIFYLTAKSSDADKLRGFMNGADDYITKPFSPLELVARVKVQLARYMKKKQVSEKHLFTCSRFTFDIDAAEITVEGVKEIISGRLFHLLKYLCDNPGQVLSKEQIYERVWGDCLFDDNTVMVHIRKLREKIEKNPGKPTCIITVRGIGYKLVGDVSS
ncbi:response regulator transcription factor [Lysinibacillus sp. ZYM-1]|uniref:response regulator transcription factor n=1 Tax=Lysinibacillus sp. ZYM-1 TaxID=1681184 RepID=UPI0006CEA562|nr:response regulator transcription factor [Lysinibacillus sp. ZYM-1]KPN95710.1 two-component system response regulator [Lysinibacillus sp. ZYM-1]